MTKTEKREWRKWWSFCGRRFREFLFLAAWTAMAWALDHYIAHPLPIDGPPKFMIRAFEGLFDIVTLFELMILLCWPYQSQALRFLKGLRRT